MEVERWKEWKNRDFEFVDGSVLVSETNTNLWTNSKSWFYHSFPPLHWWSWPWTRSWYPYLCGDMLSPSCLKVKSDGRQAKNTSLDRLHIYSPPVTDEDHVCQTCGGGPGGQNRDIHLTFLGPRLQHGYEVSLRDITTEALRHDYQASLHSAINEAKALLLNCISWRSLLDYWHLLLGVSTGNLSHRCSLQVHDLDHTHSLANIQYSGLSNQRTLFQPKIKLPTVPEINPLQSEKSILYACLCKKAADKRLTRCRPRLSYSQLPSL